MSEEAQIEMPRYQSHKKVWALKIKDVLLGNDENGEPFTELSFEDERYAPMRVPETYAVKHSPKRGGYYVVYDDGYKSWSPADAFESGYTKIN